MLEIKDVSKSFSKTLFQNISFTIEQGQRLSIMGPSGAGKTTLANALLTRFKSALPHLVRLDGDEIRALFGQGLGYREEDRYEQINRIQRLALMLDAQEQIVLVAALYAHPTAG